MSTEIARNGVDLSRFAAIVNEEGRNTAKTSPKYQFIPTKRVLDVLGQNGWYASKASQGRCNIQSRNGHQKHMVRLQNEAFRSEGAGAYPEVLLINSHEGTSAFRLMCGLFELVCSNGLIVQRESFGNYRVRHVGFTEDAVQVALDGVTNDFPQVLQAREAMRGIELARAEQIAFAGAAIELAFDGEKYAVNPESLLHVHHREQREPSLWNTYNVTQENLLQGNVPVRNKETGKVRHTAKVKQIDKDVKLNSALWRLAEEMKLIKNS